MPSRLARAAALAVVALLLLVGPAGHAPLGVRAEGGSQVAGRVHRERPAPAANRSPIASPAAALTQGDDPAAMVQGAPVDLATYPAERWIVQLADPPVAGYSGGIGSLAPTSIASTGARRLDLTTPAARAYRDHLRRAQSAFEARLRKVAPGARVDQRYTVVVNGLGVKMPADRAALVRALAGVRAVTPDLPVAPLTFGSPAQVGAPAVWERLGGASEAGRGVKVAIIDGGIFVRTDETGAYTGNPCFADDGYVMPDGFPKGDVRFTNAKVIVARAYFRPDDPPAPGSETPLPGPNRGDTAHGTHVAGTVACIPDTAAAFDGIPVRLSGVAPAAQLLSYKVFYGSLTTDTFQQGNGYIVELVKAIEDAVEDGADVISNSWGAGYQNSLAWPDPQVQAAEMAVSAGVVTVFAAGNEGAAGGTVLAPGIAPSVITVGAVNKDVTAAAGDLAVTGPAPVPEHLAAMDASAADFGPKDISAFPPAATAPPALRWAGALTADGSDTGCPVDDQSPFAAESLAGRVALLQRGAWPCTFPDQVANAEAAGALAVVIYNDAASAEALGAMGAGRDAPDVGVPSWLVRRSDGLALKALAADHPDVTVAYTARPHIAPAPGDRMAGFSSRGPSQDKFLKPDVVAPGVSVLSSGYGSGDEPDAVYTGFGAVSGTSMATPHVAGAAALLVALHPDWLPWQVKAALMATADEDVFVDTAQTVRAGVLDRGAGRVDLGRAAEPGVLFDPPSVSVGAMAPGTAFTATVAVIDAGAPGHWQTRVDRPAGQTEGSPVAIGPSVRSISVPAGGRAVLRVTVDVAADAAPGDYAGMLRVVADADGAVASVPIWVRVVPPKTVDVLVLDDDRSSNDAELADYGRAYTSTLGELELTYGYIDTHAAGLPPLAELHRYRAALLFTGDNGLRGGRSGTGLDGSERDRLTEWLDAGGRLLATGQDLAETQGSTHGLPGSRLYKGYLSLTVAVTDTFGGAPPSPSAEGLGPFVGLTLDLGAAGGAGNQRSLEATWPMTDTDTYAGLPWMQPAFAPIGGAAPPDAAVGFARSAEPSLEEPRLGIRYRALSLGFGLEGLSPEAGPAGRSAVMGRAVDWLLESGHATLSSTRASVVADTTFTVDFAFDPHAEAALLRWDFGDGTPFVTTDPRADGPTATHRYHTLDTVVARVEVTSARGHRILAATTVTVPAPLLLPALLSRGSLAGR